MRFKESSRSLLLRKRKLKNRGSHHCIRNHHCILHSFRVPFIHDTCSLTRNVIITILFETCTSICLMMSPSESSSSVYNALLYELCRAITKFTHIRCWCLDEVNFYCMIIQPCSSIDERWLLTYLDQYGWWDQHQTDILNFWSILFVSPSPKVGLVVGAWCLGKKQARSHVVCLL